MIDAKRLLDQFLGAGAGSQGGGYGRGSYGASGSYGSGGGSGLGGLLGGAGGQGSGLGGMLGDLQRQANANPMASGALAGGLASVLLGGKRGRGMSQGAMKLGGLALIAGLAYKAYQENQAKQAGGTALPSGSGHATAPTSGQEILPPPSDTPFMPSEDEADDRAQLLLTAMISAAKADGYIDPEEQGRIFDRLGSLDLDAEAKAYVMDQLRAPLDLDGIVRQASRPEVAAEVYAASVLAIDPDHPAEKAYLQMLAARLGLPDDLVEQIRRTAETARVSG